MKGPYRVEVIEDDGKQRTFAGQYKVLDVGHRIVQSFVDVASPPGLLAVELPSTLDS